MLTVATCLWDPNPSSFSFSRCYDESWVEKIYRGFARNLTVPFRFICFTERRREFMQPIGSGHLPASPSYGDFIKPFGLGAPMILVGLDTVVLRNIDHLAAWCMEDNGLLALPRDPFHWSRACNGVAMVQRGRQKIYLNHRGENDMEWLRLQPHVFIDDIFPGSVKSYKGHVRGMTEHFNGRPQGFDDIDLLYLHGVPKQHELQHVPEIARNWY